MENLLTEIQKDTLLRLIDESVNIIIITHTNPDGDALGSSLGWAEYLKGRGKSSTVIAPDRYPDFLRWLPNTEKIIRYDKHKEKCDLLFAIADLIFILDLNTASRLEEAEEALKLSKAKKVMIDHHLNPDIDVDLCVSYPDLSSTSEIVFRIVWEMGDYGCMGKNFAVPIYCGMMTDTGGFTYNSTRPELFFIIGQLLTKHIDKDKIYRNVYNNYSEWRMRLTGFVLYQKLTLVENMRACYYTLTRQDMKQFHFIKGDAEGLVNIPLQIKGMKLSIALREDSQKDNLVWVSMRSVDDFPCNIMAERFFNGGGHLNAAGGKLFCDIDKAVDSVMTAINAFADYLC